jgi:deoxyribonuclease-4
MNFGTHISSAGGVQNAPLNAHKIGCETYQFFSRSPQGGPAPKLISEVIKEFKDNNKKYNFKNYYIHAPYYINLASTKNEIYKNSIRILREELERGSLLGAKGMMFHPGSAKELNRKDAILKVSKAITEILKNYSGTCKLLIENSAGAGNVIGDDFEEIAEIIKKQSTINKGKIGICLDTCHAFASGYDLRDKKVLQKTLNEFNKIIGLKKLMVIHLNDSKHELNSHKDRHEHLGQGKIGLDGFRAIIKELRFKNMDFILETPNDSQRVKDFKILKKLRNKK